MHDFILHTQRLRLRRLTPDTYREKFTQLTNDQLMEFFGCRNDTQLAEERKKFEEGLSMYRKSLLLFQLLLPATERVIGWCGFHTWYLTHRHAEIGYMLFDESDMQQGYMKEALRAILDYGFREMELHRVDAMVASDNTASLRLLETEGFVQEGVLRENYFVNGRFEDSLIFGLLKKRHDELRGIS